MKGMLSPRPLQAIRWIATVPEVRIIYEIRVFRNPLELELGLCLAQSLRLLSRPWPFSS